MNSIQCDATLIRDQEEQQIITANIEKNENKQTKDIWLRVCLAAAIFFPTLLEHNWPIS